nr:site-specific integrase [Parapontixanthobacter aurantiacus]
MFRWAEDRGDLERSPLDRTPRPKPNPGRERFLDEHELRLVWRAAESLDHPYGSMVQLLALSGQRLGEVSGMRWDELNFDQSIWEVPKSRTKSGRGNVVPLTSQMKALLQKTQNIGPIVFSVSGSNRLGNLARLKRRLDAKIDELTREEGTLPIEHWTLHDLRRTVATALQRLGVSPDMIEVIQGRTLKLGAGQRYQRYDYLPEKQTAMAKWDAYLAQITAEQCAEESSS